MVRRFAKILLFCILASLCGSCVAAASEYHGQVTFGGLPVPGATITATQGEKKVSTVSDQGGLYDFPDLADGPWKIEIEMQCFSTIQAEVTVGANMAAGKWELTLLPLDQLMARTKLTQAPPSLPVAVNTPGAAKKREATGAAAAVAEMPKPGVGRLSGEWQREQCGDEPILARPGFREPKTEQQEPLHGRVRGGSE